MAAALAGRQRFVSGASRCRAMCLAALWLHTASIAACKLGMLSALIDFMNWNCLQAKKAASLHNAN